MTDSQTPRFPRVGRVIAGTGLAFALLGASAGVLAQPAAAQDDAPKERPSAEDRQARFEERLDKMVENGRISEERAQDMRDRVAAQADKRAQAQAAQEELASKLNMSAEELHDALRSGSSLADVAADEGVDVQVVVDHLVAQAMTKIDDAVEADKLTADQAAEKREALAENIEARVNGDKLDRESKGKRGAKRGNRGRPGMGPRGGR